MSASLLEELIELAEQLTPDERETLIEHLKHLKPREQRNILPLRGAFLPYLEGEVGDLDDVEDWLENEHQQSVERLFRQLDGDF